MIRHLHAIASLSLMTLIIVCLAWEGWLAPLRPGGTLLILKAAPLLLPLFGILRGKRYTYQWAAMFILVYFTEGVVRAWSDEGLAARFALVEILLTTAFFFSAIFYARLSAPGRPDANNHTSGEHASSATPAASRL